MKIFKNQKRMIWCQNFTCGKSSYSLWSSSSASSFGSFILFLVFGIYFKTLIKILHIYLIVPLWFASFPAFKAKLFVKPTGALITFLNNFQNLNVEWLPHMSSYCIWYNNGEHTYEQKYNWTTRNSCRIHFDLELCFL